MIYFNCKEMHWQNKSQKNEALPRIELGFPDSKSEVLTTILQGPASIVGSIIQILSTNGIIERCLPNCADVGPRTTPDLGRTTFSG